MFEHYSDFELLITLGISIRPQTFIHLLRMEIGMLLIPLIDETIVRSENALPARLLDLLFLDDSVDPFLADSQRLSDLPYRQPFDSAEMFYPAFKRFIHFVLLIIGCHYEDIFYYHRYGFNIGLYLFTGRAVSLIE